MEDNGTALQDDKVWWVCVTIQCVTILCVHMLYSAAGVWVAARTGVYAHKILWTFLLIFVCFQHL